MRSHRSNSSAVPSEWAGKILVPYCLESKLGGVQRLLDATEALWYRRTFEALKRPTANRTLLNFEAVDYRCEVLVNGTSVGSAPGWEYAIFVRYHRCPVQDGENELVVRVEDETEGWQLRGKQVLNARGIWYTQVSGIWQTVWLEQVGASYIEDLTDHTDAGKRTIKIRAGDRRRGRPRHTFALSSRTDEQGGCRGSRGDGRIVAGQDQGCQAVVARFTAPLRS